MTPTTYHAVPEFLKWSRYLGLLIVALAVQCNPARGDNATPGDVQITTEPTDQTVFLDDAATFTVQATGSAPLSYQWYWDEIPLADGTNATYVVSSAQEDFDGAALYCEIDCTNSNGDLSFALSRNAILGVVPLRFVSQPHDEDVQSFHAALFSVGVYRTASATYQWFCNGSAISGATSSSYVFSNPKTTDNGSRFYCAVSVPYRGERKTNNSHVAYLYVDRDPQDQSVYAGANATFTVPSFYLNYQWYCGANKLNGATNPAYCFQNTQLTDDQKTFFCVYSGYIGTDFVTTTSRVATLSVAEWKVYGDPLDQTVYVDGNATFSIGASLVGTNTFQWFRDGKPMPGATDSTLILRNVQTNDNKAEFICEVINRFNQVSTNYMSPPAILTVLSLPEVGVYVTGTRTEPYSSFTVDPYWWPNTFGDAIGSMALGDSSGANRNPVLTINGLSWTTYDPTYMNGPNSPWHLQIDTPYKLDYRYFYTQGIRPFGCCDVYSIIGGVERRLTPPNFALGFQSQLSSYNLAAGSVNFVLRPKNFDIAVVGPTDKNGQFVADGVSPLQAQLRDTVDGLTFWGIQGPDNGCRIDPVTGVIAVGTKAGGINIVVTNIYFGSNFCVSAPHVVMLAPACTLKMNIAGRLPHHGIYSQTPDGVTQLRVETEGGVAPIRMWVGSGTNLCQINTTANGHFLTVGKLQGEVIIYAMDAAGCSQELVLNLAGCSSCSSTCPATVNNKCVEVGINLGWSGLGDSAGSLLIREDTPSDWLATPRSLAYDSTRPDVEVIRGADGNLAQIMAPQYLANVVSNSTHRFSVSLYKRDAVGAIAAGRHLLSGDPFRTVTIENPNDDTNHVRITDAAIGGSSISDFYWVGSGWELVTGGGLRKEFRTTEWSAGNTIKTDTVLVKNADDTVASREVQVRQIFPWGEALVKGITGSGASARTNTYGYTANGLLQQTVHGDGSWEYLVFDDQDRVTDSFSTFLNQGMTTDPALCRHLANSYSPDVVANSNDDPAVSPSTPRRTIEYVLGQEIGRTYQVLRPGERRDIRCVTPGAAWDDPNNLVTVTKFFQYGSHEDEVQSVLNPDGTIQIYIYNGPPASQTNIVLSGHPDSTGTNIDDGTCTISVYGSVGQLLTQQTIDVASGIVIGNENYAYDDLKRLTNTVYMDGTVSTLVYDCCDVTTSVDRDGTVTSYGYDLLKRRTSTTQNGITTWSVFDAAGNTVTSFRIGTDGSRITNSTAVFDDSGIMISSRDAFGLPTLFTNYFDAIGQTVRQTTYPDLSTRIEVTAIDGSTMSSSGTAVHAIRYDYGVENDGGAPRLFTTTIPLNADLTDSTEWTKSYRDMVGRSYKTVYPDGASATTYFDPQGRQAKTVDPDGVTQLFQYNAKGELEYSALDADRDGQISFAGNDRITRTVNDVVAAHDTYVRRTRVYEWPTAGVDRALLVSTSEQEVTGQRSWSSSFGLTNFTQVNVLGQGVRILTQVLPDGSLVIATNLFGRQISATRLAGDGSLLSQTTFGYDAHGRQSIVADARTGASTNTYTVADQVETVAAPAPAPGQPSPVTTLFYDAMGRNWKVNNPDGTSVTNEFYATGERRTTYGSRQYPVAYTYDDQGRLKTMKTWQNFAADGGAAVTAWNYDSQRGYLQSKQYPDSHGPSYTYTFGGRLQSRTWARGVTATYAYDSLGQLTNAGYSDGTAPVGRGFDRLGRAVSVSDIGSRTTAYSDAGQVLSDDYSIAGLNYASQVRLQYDRLFRRTNWSSLTLGSTTGYSYDAASRLSTVSSGTLSARYTYLANSPLVDHIDFQQNGATRMTTTKQYDLANRLTNVASAWTLNAATLNSSTYGYNQANQRTNHLREDGARWVYQYDNLGQVISGKKYWADGTPVAGLQFEYAFDDIGNRTQTKSGGDQSGSGLRPAAYSANNLNQYTNREVPGYVEAQGAAAAGATVSVNGTPAYRKGEFFRSEIGLDNSSLPVNAGVTNQATLGGDTVTWSRHALIAATPESFQYDLDGNLTQDGKWTYRWDAENRLISMESLAAIPTEARRRLEYAYDSTGRRVYQKISTWDSVADNYKLATEERYWYDGWNIVGRSSSAGNLVQGFVWGLDLSGSPQGAVGVGGLLWLSELSDSGTNAPSTHFVNFDGNGNVLSLVNAADGTPTASYEYDPFGETLRASGPMALANPFRFSTKFQDEESGLFYYGLRYYNPRSGSWLSRDLIVENGGLNLYGAAENDLIGLFDMLGLSDADARWVLHWHHDAPVEIFEGRNGNPAYIESRNIKLAEGVNIHTKERAMMLRAGDHTYKAEIGTHWEGGIHIEGFNREWKKWIDSLPKGEVITSQMLDEQIAKIYSMPQFAPYRDKGLSPKFPTYQEYQAGLKTAEAEAEAEIRSSTGKGALRCSGLVFFAIQVGPLINDFQRMNADGQNLNPWIGFDTDNHWFSVGRYRESDWRIPLVYDHYKVTGYFVVSMSGPHKGDTFDIPEKIFNELESQLKEAGQTKNGPW